MLMKIHVVLEV